MRTEEELDPRTSCGEAQGVPMGVETIGEAYMLGWRIHVRCAWGRREAMKSVRACLGKAELDLHTLVWTRGAAFPISQLIAGSNVPCAARAG
jgi:hypothetical protein